MIKSKRFDDITIHLYEEQYRDALYRFKLNERQRIYSSLPEEVLDDALNDPNRKANVVLNNDGMLLVFLSYINIINMKVMIPLKKLFIFVRYLSMNSFKVMAMVLKS